MRIPGERGLRLTLPPRRANQVSYMTDSSWKWRGWIFATLALSVGFGASAEPVPSEAVEKPGVVRLAFWNIEWFPGKRPEATRWEIADHIPLVQNVVREMNPDIMGIVEIRDEASAALAVAPLPRFSVLVCSQFPGRDGGIGFQQLAITSRFPAVSAWAEAWVSKGDVVLPRGFSFAAFPIGSDSMLLVYAVHFKSNRGDIQLNIPAREASSKQLLAHAERMEEIYGKAYKHVSTVFGGDFNTALEDERFASERTLRDLVKAGYEWGWKNVEIEKRTTLPASPQMDPARTPFPNASFDHVFVKGAKILSCEAFPSSPLASDHRPVVLTIQVPVSAQEVVETTAR